MTHAFPPLPRKYTRPVTVFLDQDGPLADFEAECTRHGLKPSEAKMRPGWYSRLPVTPGAKEAVRELLAMPLFQLFVATKIPDENPLAATEKLFWLRAEFPELEERVIITPNKACLGTAADVLVDDRPHKADAGHFPGTFVHFASPALPDWAAVMPVLRALHAQRQAERG